jgi:hypothetical protein
MNAQRYIATALNLIDQNIHITARLKKHKKFVP